jgi:hypothetical protein
MRIVSVLALALACSACSIAPKLPDRYSQCTDLGTLRLASFSADDAEDRMRAQVAILGGDLLLFNAGGRAEDGSGVPSPLAQRRIALTAPAESINGRQPQLAALDASIAAAAQTQEELWYYGAALRCKQPGGAG